MIDDMRDQVSPDQPSHVGAPGGAQQNVRNGYVPAGVARPGGATQNSGGALLTNEDELGKELARKTD